MTWTVLSSKKRAPADVGGDDVLGELAVRASGGTKGRLDLLGEDRIGATLVTHDLADAEDAALVCVLGDDPVHQLCERDRPHDVAHGVSSSPAPSRPRDVASVDNAGEPTPTRRPRGGRLVLVQTPSGRGRVARSQPGHAHGPAPLRRPEGGLTSRCDGSGRPRASWTARGSRR